MKISAPCLLLLALVAHAAAQSEDELHIPEENDNQFPPDQSLDTDGSLVEGSGAGTIEDPLDVAITDDGDDALENAVDGTANTDGEAGAIEEPVDVSVNADDGANATEKPVDETVTTEGGADATEDPGDLTVTTEAKPLIEDVLLSVSESILPATEEADSACPKPCVCHFEGESDEFVVDCSGYGLTEFPTPLDAKTTTLNIQNNKLTEIPKDVSTLKNLKVLNADSNSIMDLAAGSISELPELTILKLGNNRLIEYPKDLKNGFGLTKLEELDLGGNDMRTTLNGDIFSHFKALKKLTLPEGAKDLVEDLCNSLKATLVTVCTESCNKDTFECPQAPTTFEDDFLNVILPGTIALSSSFAGEGNGEPSIPSDAKSGNGEDNTTDAPKESDISSADANPSDEFSLRSAVNKAPAGISPMSTLVEAPKEGTDSKNNVEEHKEADVAVGATTSGSKTGGVDKSVIGMIVAGMVLVVAGVTIKKNWSSIRNKFSSTPRAANERPGANANGTSPEEVPLQEKLPV